jgi:hypothetical protein
LPIKYECCEVNVNSAIEHCDDMACEINEGWITGALMYLIFTLPGSKF